MNARQAVRLGALIVAAGLVVPALTLASGAAQAAPPAPTRTVLSTAKTTVPVGTAVKLKATVKPVVGSGQPAGTVTFTEGASTLGSGPLALVNNVETVTLTLSTFAVGTHQLTATYAGSAPFATSTSLPITLTVTPPATTTSLSTSTPSVLMGKSVKLKSVVRVPSGASTPTGSVTFTEGATTLGTAPLALVGSAYTARLTVTGLPLGDHSIVATYAGSVSLAGSASKVLTVSVVKATTTTTMLQAPGVNPGDYSLNVTVKRELPATGVPTGLVTYVVDGSAPQVFALNAFGKASLDVTLSVGDSHTVKVTYGGDATSLASQTTVTFIG